MQSSQENISVGVYLCKDAETLTKKQILANMFSWEFCKKVDNTFSIV